MYIFLSFRLGALWQVCAAPVASISELRQRHVGITRGSSRLRAPVRSTPTAFTNRPRRRRAQISTNMLASLILAIVHASYTLWTLVLYYARRTCTSAPRPLEYPRRQTPKHLALVLVTADGRLREEEEEAYMCKTVVDVVGWCKRAGIETLSVYNRQGMHARSLSILKRLMRPFFRRAI